eukprot:5517318-Pyramimonas_sp.AAC.1
MLSPTPAPHSHRGSHLPALPSLSYVQVQTPPQHLVAPPRGRGPTRPLLRQPSTAADRPGRLLRQRESRTIAAVGAGSSERGQGHL